MLPYLFAEMVELGEQVLIECEKRGLSRMQTVVEIYEAMEMARVVKVVEPSELVH